MVNDQYFPLEANLPDDDRLCLLIEQMGMEGMGIYINLLIELRRRNDYRLNMQSLPRIARNMRCKFYKVLEVIVDFDLFHLEGNFENGVLSSPYIDRVMSKLDAVRERKKTSGLKGLTAVKRAGNGQFTAKAVTVKKSKEKKSKEKKSKEEKSTSSSAEEETAAAAAAAVEKLNAILSWETYVNQAMNEQAWLEVAGMQSGLGADYINHLDYIIRSFKDHICAQGNEEKILSLRDAKSYFTNYIRNGTPTNKRVRELLAKEKVRREKENPYRYEDTNPPTGVRSYCGIPLPADAPPRPGPNAIWNEVERRWSD